MSCFGDGVFGPTDDGRRKPDILAPGCGVKSAVAGSGCGADLDELIAEETSAHETCAPEGIHCYTSFATPVVSAAAAIARQYFVEGWYPTGTPNQDDEVEPSGALLKAILLNSAAKTSEGTTYPSDEEGWGLLQLDRILPLGNGTSKLRFWDVRHVDGLAAPEFQPFEVKVAPHSEQLKVTLVWTEPAPPPNSYKDPVVSNLDLVVTAPDQTTTYLGNVFDHNESATGGAADERNNVEMVLINTPDHGTWSIRVVATEVNVLEADKAQGFALVVSGDFV
jgi:hypothetical protein